MALLISLCQPTEHSERERIVTRSKRQGGKIMGSAHKHGCSDALYDSNEPTG
jgi:hypothetical protein